MQYTRYLIELYGYSLQLSLDFYLYPLDLIANNRVKYSKNPKNILNHSIIRPQQVGVFSGGSSAQSTPSSFVYAVGGNDGR